MIELLENIEILLYSIHNHSTDSGNIFYKEIDGKYLLNLCNKINDMCAKIRKNCNDDGKPITNFERQKIDNYNKYYNLESSKSPISFVNNISSTEKVNHPSHYTWLKDLCGIEVIDIARHLNFNIGNVLKYTLRAGRKKEEGMSDKQKHIEDLKKAKFYIEDEIKRLSK